VVKVILRAKLDGGAQICSVLGRSFTVWPCLGFHSDWLAYDDNKYYTNSVSAYQCIIFCDCCSSPGSQSYSPILSSRHKYPIVLRTSLCTRTSFSSRSIL